MTTITHYEPRIMKYAALNAPLFPQTDKLWIRKDNANVQTDTNDIFSGKLVVVFTIPGALTPVCQNQFKDFVKHEKEFFNLGVSKIICLAKDTIDVMTAWHASVNPHSSIQMVSDPYLELPKPLDVELFTAKDAPSRLGSCTYQRSAMILKDGKVRYHIIEDMAKTCRMSSARDLLEIVKKIVESEKLLVNLEKERENTIRSKL